MHGLLVLLPLIAAAVRLAPVFLQEAQDSDEIAVYEIAPEEIQEDLDELHQELEELGDTTGDIGIEAIETLLAQKEAELAELNEVIEDLEALDEECQQWSSCTECLQAEGCVWCSVDNLCYFGDEEGPSVGNCYSFATEECFVSCESATSVDDCSLSDSCVWCESSSTCLEDPESCV